jgi:signal transduction histidine kinase
MGRQIRDLLDVASIEAGHLALEAQVEDPAAILARVADLFAAAAHDAGVALELREVRDLPTIRADADRVIQALGNLVTNALKFTDRGGRVTLSAERDMGSVRFAVEDTGAGIPAEELSHVFDRFWQRRRGATRRGTGLGLPIVRGIVEAHGGELSVQSMPDSGSRFSFTIPAAT